MTEVEIQAVEAIRDLQKKMSLKEHVINAFEAVLSAFPVAGAFASLMNDYIPDQRAKRVISFARAVAQDLEGIANKLDVEYLRSDQFAYMLQRCLEGALADYQKQKLRSFKWLLVNSAAGTRGDEAKQQLFLYILDQLQESHIVMLGVIWDAFQKPRPEPWLGEIVLYALPVLAKFPGLTPQQVTMLAKELENRGLLENCTYGGEWTLQFTHTGIEFAKYISGHTKGAAYAPTSQGIHE